MRKIKNKKAKLIYIEWEDATANIASAWHSEENAISWAEREQALIKQSGWLIKETEKYILLAARQFYNGVSIDYGDVFKIPNGWVRKRINLSSLLAP